MQTNAKPASLARMRQHLRFNALGMACGFATIMMFMPTDSFHPVFTMQGRQSAKRPLARTIGEISAVAALAAHAKALDALDRALRQCLPEPLRRQCCLADLRAGRLVFLASSPAWAAKLRFLQAPLLAEARKTAGVPVGKFAVKVAPLPPVPPGQIRRKPLSHAAADHLKAAAQSVADPGLRAAYLRLASLAE